MAGRNKWRDLEATVVARPGAEQRLAQRRLETLAEIGLHTLRTNAGLSQADLAARMGLTQVAVSKAERSGDPRISTLRAYLAAFDAELRVSAVFPDGTSYELQVGAQEAEPEPTPEPSREEKFQERLTKTRDASRKFLHDPQAPSRKGHK